MFEQSLIGEESGTRKASSVLISFLVQMAVLAVIAAALLTNTQKFAYEAFTSPSARVSDPGYNLVGPRWTGEASVGRS